MILRKDFKFIDLFAGIGGFHCAMDRYSDGQAVCIMASEINSDAKRIYEKNFKMKVMGDITKINKVDINEYVDVVCAGFPCQTFSKAGMQQGFGDPRGTLFKEIIRLIENDDITFQPRLLILENVRNLITHDNGVTWNTIRRELEKINYNVIKTPIVAGPKDFGIPQLRDRAIIVAVRKDIYNGEITLNMPRKNSNSTDIETILSKRLTREEKEKLKISAHQEMVLKCWDDFIKGIKYVPTVIKDNQKRTRTIEMKEFIGTIGFPIWAFEFKEVYDWTDEKLNYPLWKQEFIEKNRYLYTFNKKFIDEWLLKWNDLADFTTTEKKMEWQCGPDYKSVWEGIIQFRPSGVRVKQPTESPTLVAMVHNPIIGKYKRFMSIKEAARLQSFPETYDFRDESDFNAYKQLGNAVNVEVIYQVFKEFVNFLEKQLNETGGDLNG